MNQPAHLDHCRRGPDVTKHCPVGLPDFLPILDIDDIHPRPYDVLQARTGRVQCSLNIEENLRCLSIRIANTDNLSRASVDVVPETHTCCPTRTAREYPTIGSQGVPVAIRILFIKRHTELSPQVPKGICIEN